ncbi:hypothetical protein OC835_002486 [Tilletia horrida]|nr:hypothetical protein OC835_002486 [Tilletia horrida]
MRIATTLASTLASVLLGLALAPSHQHSFATAAPVQVQAQVQAEGASSSSSPLARGLTPIHIGGLTTYSNDPSYTLAAARTDLNKIMDWAGDSGRLSASQTTETLAAILDCANRYFPELPTKKIARAIMADIRAESDFSAGAVSPGRAGSGDSWGLLQVSQDGSRELTLFQDHARIKTSRAGALPDWPASSGSTLNVRALTKGDLLRPWINIHIATWVQANLGKTGSLDPYDWAAVNQGSRSSTGGCARNMRTAYGSWVAGPHPDGQSSYLRSGDHISAPYLRRIVNGVSAISGQPLSLSWLEGLTLNAGVVDFH